MNVQNSPLSKHFISLILILFPVAGQVSCNLIKEENRDPEFIKAQAQRLGYDLENPGEKIRLHYDLEEISGLSFVEEGILACVQDELGRVYFFSLKDKKILYSDKFSGNGDYEGVEFVNGMVYVMENDGTLYHYRTIVGEGTELQAQSIKTPLTLRNDVEGLGLLATSEKLLIACKGKGDIDGEKVKGKAIYAFDLKKNQFERKPFLTIGKGDITKFIKKNPDNYKIKKTPNFKPSGIAMHPKTKKIYVLNSVGKLLIILNENGVIEDLAVLNSRIFRQPEGICFAPNGDLYIASEGQGGRGYILTFDYRK